MTWQALILAVFGLGAWAQLPPPDRPANGPESMRLPDGRSRAEMILKADHAASLKDLESMRKLMDEVRMEMEKNDRHVLSVGALKKLEEIEKLSKKIRGRLTRY